MGKKIKKKGEAMKRAVCLLALTLVFLMIGGWAMAQQDPIIYPGTAMFIERLANSAAGSASLTGEVLEGLFAKCLKAGDLSFLGIEYNESRPNQSLNRPLQLVGSEQDHVGVYISERR